MRLAPNAQFTVAKCHAPGGQRGAYFTASKMRALINEFAHRPEILNLAVTLIHQHPQHDQTCEAAAIFDFVRAHIRYVRDPVGIESLADPLATLRRGVGDCDDQTTLLGALLEAVGYPVRIVLAGYHGADYEHVYLQVLCADEWRACDPTVHVNFGWEPENATCLWIENR